ncbi:MAG: HEAT repeat domain-containing protein [Nitrospinota bacterium]
MDFTLFANLFSDENILIVAEWVVNFVLSATVIMSIFVLVVRFFHLAGGKARTRLMEKWEGLMLQSIEGDVVDLPRLTKGQARQLMDLWNRYFEYEDGSAIVGLIRFAQSTGLDDAAWRMIHHGNVKSKLIACVTLGNLRVVRVWPRLLDMVENHHPILSLAAARAMVKINSAESVKIIIPMIVRRTDWPPVIVANLLRQMGAQAISIPLAKEILKADDRQVSWLMQFLREASYVKIKHVIYSTLAVTKDAQAISACLKGIKDTDNLAMIRGFLDHETWFVRVQAVKLLALTGLWQDEQRLINMLADQNWWVRYRTAQALADMPFTGTDKLRQIMEKHWDRYAKDIIKMVLAERVAV